MLFYLFSKHSSEFYLLYFLFSIQLNFKKYEGAREIFWMLVVMDDIAFEHFCNALWYWKGDKTKENPTGKMIMS